MSQPKRPDSVRLQNIVQSYWTSATLMSAVELGLFTAVAKGATNIEKVASALDITPTNAERLVTVCIAMNLLEKDENGLNNAPDVERFLVEGERYYAGPCMLFSKPRWGGWGNLTENLREKETKRLGMYDEFTVEAARRYHTATYSIGVGAGRRFSRQVDLSERRKILDIGGGSGAYSIVAAQQHPHLQAVVFDLPPVVEVSKDFIAENGVSDRVSTQGGDFTSDPFPDDVDVAIMASNLPQYSQEIIQQVIQKAFDALLPGGEMHLIGEMLNDDKTGPLNAALWGLSEALSGSTGRAHSESECIGYFECAGFTNVAALPFIEGVLVRVTGSKPA
ncbi:MAG: methyltransferase [Pseudomonadota bacterium]